MKRLIVAAGSVALALALGCERPPTVDPSGDGGTPNETDPKSGSAIVAPDEGAASTVALKRAGAGHTANIDLVALSSDGKVAVTRDQIGSVRVWPTLDGEVEPIVIPDRGAQSMSVERRGEEIVIATVGASQGGKIFVVDGQGRVAVAAELPPFKPLFSATVLPGGDAVVVLRRDHALVVVDTEGQEITTLNEKRFRPNSIAVAASGAALLAITKERGGQKVELQRVAIEGRGEKTTLKRIGPARTIESTAALMPSSLAVSQDVTRVAWADKAVGNEWELHIAETAGSDAPKVLNVAVPSHLTPNLGFAGDTQLLVSANDGTLSWLIDAKTQKMRARDAAPQDFVNQGRAQAVAGGRQVAGHGTWLFVYDLQQRKQQYLGYRSFQTQAVALSPKAEHVAWSYVAGPVIVEAIDEDASTATKLPTDPNFGAFKLRFVDEDHLLTVSAMGAVKLVEWRTGAVVGEVGVNGSIRNVDFEPQRGLLLIDRHNNDARVFEVTPKGFTGPYIVADQAYRSGLLASGLPGEKDAVLWSLDSSNRMRAYSLDKLRADLTTKDIETLGQPLPAGAVAPLAIDRQGRRYGVRWDGSSMQLFVDTAGDLKTKVSPAGDVNQIVVSPDGATFLAVHQRGQTSSLSAHRSKDLERVWVYSTGVFNNEVVWSADSRFVGIAANTGAAVLSAESGEPVRRRCGLEFVSVASPPTNAFNGLQLQSLCEP